MSRLALQEYLNDRIKNVKYYIEFNERKDDKDFFAHKELELYQMAQKYMKLTNELGCPLEICLKIMLNKIREITINYSDGGGYGSIYSEYITADISSIYYDIRKGIIIETNLCEVPIKDYKVNWFLKGDLSE